jgi:diacylglycerol O-acyltransferase / wax synthase
MRQLSGQDASFLYLDSPNGEVHGTMVFIYDPSSAAKQPIGFKDILRHVESRLSVSSIFRQRLVRVPFELDFPYWVDDENFDIEYHVRHMALPKPCDWRQFYILASRLNAPPLDLTRPPWEMIVIEGLDNLEGLPKGCFALLIKGHHCALDGHSAAELTMGLHDLSADGSQRVAVPPVTYSSNDSVSLLTMLGNALSNNLSAPLRMLAPARRALPGMATMLSRFYTRVKAAPESNPVTRFNGKRSPHRVFALRSYPLDDIKRIRKAVPGATVNDTVLSIAAGTVREYLAAKDELPEVTLRVMAPINTRIESEFGTGGNSISMFFPDVHTQIADPIKRLAAVYESTRHAKELADGIGAREMTDLNRHSPAAITMLASKLLTQSLGSDDATPFFHFGLSNAPGPTVPLYLCGAKLQAWTVLIPLFNSLGLAFGVTSYLDKLTMSFTADRAAVPDPEFLQACLDRSFVAHLKGANEMLRKHPRLLTAASSVKRRAHPGMAAMGRSAATESAPSPQTAVRRKKAVAPTASVPKRAVVARAARAAKAAPTSQSGAHK